ncbi:hypothetical protein ACHBTE_15230 [Streptomyces sp. M41]|uniref:hypothetical protein n=1 Tax=Streptomyces sp. M41 TaxID=3059412 RepID=UPI00374DBD60
MSDADLIRRIRSTAPDWALPQPYAPGTAVDASQPLRELRRRHLPAMAAYAGLCVEDSYAQVLAADAFRRSERGIRVFEPEDALRLQLLLTVTQAAQRWAVKGHRAILKREFVQWIDQQAAQDRRDHGPLGHERAASSEEDSDPVRWAVYTLPPRTRSLLWYIVIEAADPQNTAAMLGLTPRCLSGRRDELLHRLRSAYLLQHTTRTDASCRNLTKLLDVTTRPGAATYRIACVDEHLARCSACATAHEHLTRLFRRPDILLAEAVLPWAPAAYLKIGRTVLVAPPPLIRPTHTAPAARHGFGQDLRRSARHARRTAAIPSVKTAATVTALALVTVGAAAALSRSHQRYADDERPPRASPAPVPEDTEATASTAPSPAPQATEGTAPSPSPVPEDTETTSPSPMPKDTEATTASPMAGAMDASNSGCCSTAWPQALRRALGAEGVVDGVVRLSGREWETGIERVLPTPLSPFPQPQGGSPPRSR